MSKKSINKASSQLGPLSFKRLIVVVFIASLVWHLVGLGQQGRTWDEQFKVDLGYVGWQNLLQGKWQKEFWMDGIEHPMVAKYIYGAVLPWGMLDVTPPFTPSPAQEPHIKSNLWSLTRFGSNLFLVPYDLEAPRFLSAVFNSLTVALTFYFAANWLGLVYGFAAAAALLLMPRFLVMGQLVTFESLSAAFLVLVLYFLIKRRLWLPMLLTALAFWTRYSNAYFLLFTAGFLWLNPERRQEIKHWLWLPVVIFAVGMLTWPLLWNDFPTYLLRTFTEHESRGFGPSLYFFRYLLVTTPIPILALSILGLFRADKFTLWWVGSTLVFYSLISVTGGGTRYIFLIYPAMAILCAYGLRLLASKSSRLSLAAGIIGVMWSIISFAQAYPYHLDYYNELVGGTAGAASRGYDISWWGEGQRAAALWLQQHAQEGDSVALYVTPKYVFPSVFFPQLQYFPYGAGAGESKYLVVSRSDLASLSSQLTRYQLVHEAKVGSATTLVSVYQLSK